jgi:hypothetical protein
VAVGEAPDEYLQKNVGLAEDLEASGRLQVVTARSNGKMFGYLMAIISPSLDNPERTSSMHTTFFASKAAPGLGLRLQRKSIELLRERGVDDVYFREGDRGDGPRMAPLYKRLGAVPFGKLHKLELTET